MRNYFCNSHTKLSLFAVGALVLPLTVSGLEHNADAYANMSASGLEEVQRYTTGSAEVIVEKENIVFVPYVVWPVDDPEVSSGYGWRLPSCALCSANHQGVDFTPGEGTPVYAAMKGVIKDFGPKGSYGIYVLIEHDFFNGAEGARVWETVYAHLERDSIPSWVQIGAEVEAGQQIGTVGQTGITSGPHLHFELRENGRKINPMPFMEEKIELRERAEELGVDIFSD